MLVDEKKPPIDRWAIQNDLFSSLCVSGDEQVKNYLDFSDAYYGEDSYLSTVNVAHNLASLYFRAFDEPFAEEIRDYAINYFKKIYLNWAGSLKKQTSILMHYFVHL